MSFLRELAVASTQLLFPPSCLLCKRQLSSRQLPFVCERCAAGLQFITSPRCLCCGVPFPAGVDHLCSTCLRGDYHFDLARAPLTYAGPIPDLVHTLKFRGRLSGLASMAHLAQSSGILDDFTEPDLILPVPLHPSRLRKRGFNQALLLAKSLFPSWQKRINPYLLVKKQETRAQIELKGRERRRNLRGAFALHTPDAVAGKKILLVDDIFTTGSTVDRCSEIVKRARCKRVEVCTLAMAVPDKNIIATS